MPEKHKTDAQNDRRKQGSRQLTIVLLVLAVVIAAATIYQFYPRKKAPPKPPVKTVRNDEAWKIRAKIENALVVDEETADNPSAGIQELRRKVLHEFRAKAAMYVRGNPDDVIVRPMLARLWLRLGEVDEADGVVKNLLKLAPDSAEGLYLKGEVLRRRGQGGYIELFRRAAESSRADAEIWSAYGLSMLADGHDRQAEKYLVKALRPRRETAGELTAKDVGLLVSVGELAMRRGDFGEAADRLAEAWKLAPTRFDVAVKLVEAQRKAGRLDAAERTVRRALATFGKWKRKMKLRLEEGKIFLAQGRWVEAVELSDEAGRHKPLRGEAALLAAMCYYQLGKLTLATEQIDIAARLRPDDEQVRMLVGKIRAAQRGDSPQKNK